MWGDFGRPERADEVHWDCAQAPLPSGTLDSSGGLLLYFDCQLGYTGARTVNDVDAVLGLGIAYEDVHHPERECTNPLYVHIGLCGEDYCDPDDPGLLEDGSSSPALTVWDCSPGGAFLLGADFSGTNPTDGKRLADFHMTFTRPPHGVASADPALAGVTGNGGVRGVGSGAWDSDVTYLPPTYLGGTVRNGDFAPAGGLWFTFYALVSQSTLDAFTLPDEVPASYGSKACGEHGSGVRRNWDCDLTHWWNPAMGGTANPDGARPGDPYHLRDTDCYDGAASDGRGVHASLAPLSDDPSCPRAG